MCEPKQQHSHSGIWYRRGGIAAFWVARFNMKLRIAPAYTENSFNKHESDGQRLKGGHRRGGSCPLTFPLSASADWTHHIAKRAFDSGSKSGGRKSRISARFVVGLDHRWSNDLRYRWRWRWWYWRAGSNAGAWGAYASWIFLFQRFPKQVKGGFLIEGGTSRLALRGDSLRRKIENWRNLSKTQLNIGNTRW